MTNLEEHDINYTIEKMEEKARDFRKILFDIDFSKLLLNGRKINIDKLLVDKIRELRNTYCRVEGIDPTCKKKETGGILGGNINNNEGGIISKYTRIDKMFYGEGDAIAMHHSNEKDLLFHTHPNAFGTWNKASPPSEFDLYHTLDLGTGGKNIINLVWDKYGVYIYYLFPGIVKQLINNVNVGGNRDHLINLLRYTKMGFGFFWKNKDYKGHYSISDATSFSKYRNLLKTMGFYVDFKPYDKIIEFIIPR
jgi:hypothetical protein